MGLFRLKRGHLPGLYYEERYQRGSIESGVRLTNRVVCSLDFYLDSQPAAPFWGIFFGVVRRKIPKR
jgi:hypothetical protein